MPPELSSIPMIARRAIEAELALRLYEAALPRVGEAKALEILDAAIDGAAREAGQAFAAAAPGGAPGLAHFATVLERWQAGGALSIEDIRLDGNTLGFRVTRCGYMELYRDMGVPQKLHASLSCRRDASFAAGYSRNLVMERPETISAGAPACLFRFTWKA